VAPAAAKPLPQATIKLQVAPQAAAARRPAAKPDGEKIELPVTDFSESESGGEELPAPLLYAAVGLAVVALGIQLWTFLS
jgi:hypothetical protein